MGVDANLAIVTILPTVGRSERQRGHDPPPNMHHLEGSLRTFIWLPDSEVTGVPMKDFPILPIGKEIFVITQMGFS